MVHLENDTILQMLHRHEDQNGPILLMNLHQEIEKEQIQATNHRPEQHEKEQIQIAMHPQLGRHGNVPIQVTNHRQEPIGGEQILIQMKNHREDENDMILIKVHNEILFMILTNQMARSQKAKWPMAEKLASIPRVVFILVSFGPGFDRPVVPATGK